jgi:hypothetical protein
MKKDVDSYVQQCSVCQQAKHSHSHPAGLLQPLPIPDGVWQDLSMDFIEGLPKSEGYSVILVVVDRLTKIAHFIPVKHPYTTVSIAKVFLDNIVKLHGLPKTIVTDRDTIFVSHFWKELFKLYRVDLNFTTAYHPQTDGQTERVNQCLEMFLRCSVQDSPKNWKYWLSLAELWAQHLMALKQRLESAQNRMKIQADKNRVDKEFTVGDKVLLKLQPYTQSSVASRPFPKLSYK